MCFQLDGISLAELKQNHGPESDGGVWGREERLFQTRRLGRASLGVISHQRPGQKEGARVNSE